VWTSGPANVPLIIKDESKSIIAPHGLTWADLTQLSEAGLIEVMQIGIRNVTFDGLPGGLSYHGREHLLSRPQSYSKPDPDTLTIGICTFTNIGSELFKIASARPDEGYRTEVLSYYRRHEWEIQD